MNREILFRGKSVETNEWVYGSYILEKYGNTPYICYFEYGTFVNIKQVEVIPETVGEFTGMTDKNGTKIFEGDIVRTQPFYTRPYSAKRKEKQFLGIVECHTESFRNPDSPTNGQKYYSYWRVNIVEDIGDYGYYNWTRFWNCEVIGNKFDNLELLQKE